MMKKLPFNYPPLVDAFSGGAGKMAVQMTDYKQLPLLLSNHLTIAYYYDINTIGFNWYCYNEDGFKLTEIEEDLIEVEKNKNIIPYLIECLDKDYYMHLYLDHYYISDCDSYRKRHFLHDSATVFGYDTASNVFYAADNFKDRKYVIMEIPFNQIEDAIRGAIDKPATKYKLDKSINFTLEIDAIILIIKGYLESTYLVDGPKKHPKDIKVAYGMEIYDVLFSYLNRLIEGYDRYDHRSFHVMCNHKAVLVALVKYLIEKNLVLNGASILARFEELHSKFMTLRNVFLKYSITKNINLLSKVQENLNNIKQLEKDSLNLLLNNIVTIA
ncbi:hypothetical protein JHL18_11675 [Clostridium sp. YIM B02505]|uniref:Butirosin biosynthesis protein H N-terminal domain-containing protein n=1 Tax=Clostridium yunnanense TaxID=2800325 RepID=A0ABS1EPL8_9CLOT|nr:hypothetical protein [Clostridium yunnanense]MBK1811285.1 hypothetical protein [Clostridium yunnanense]